MPSFPISPDPQYSPDTFGMGTGQTDVSSKIPKFFGYRSKNADLSVQIGTDGYFGPSLPWAFVGSTSNNNNYGQPTLAHTVPLGSYIAIVSEIGIDQFQAAIVKEFTRDIIVPPEQEGVVKPTKVVCNHFNWNF